MAIYYKGNKVSPIKHETSYIEVPSGQEPPASIDSTTTVTVTRDLWEDLETAVKNRTGTYSTATFNARDMIQELNGDYNVHLTQPIALRPNSTWTRPSDWPNLDSLNLTFSGTNSFIYMTYRTGHTDDFFACYIKTASGTATIEFGQINNGTFSASESVTKGNTSGQNYWKYLNANEGYNEGYIVIKVTGRLTQFRLITANSSSTPASPDSRTMNGITQPMLERIAYIPEITSFYSSVSSLWGTYHLERDRVGNGTGNACTNIADMYYWCLHLQDLDLTEFYTPNVTTFYETFRWCTSVQEIDIAHWVTNKVTTFSCMFYGCISLKQVDMSNWDSSLVTSFNSMFYDCRSLKHIEGLGNLNTAKVTSVANLFYGCRSLDNVSDIKNWTIANITGLNATFYCCYRVTDLDISSWDISKVTRTDSMFNGCYSLKNVKFPSGTTANITTTASMFNNCCSLQNIDVSWLKMNAGTCTQISNMFNNCRSITELNIPPNWDLTALNNSNYSHYYAFANCYALKKITGITNWDFRSTTTQSGAAMFQNCFSLTDLDISGWKMNSNNYSSFFSGCMSLESVNISGFDFSNCTSLASMFNGCHRLQSITWPTGTINTSNITSLASMFYNCFSLPSITLNFSDVSKVTTTASMFYACTALTSISINNWTLTKCTTIADMFRYCYQLQELSWTGWSLPALTTNPSTLLAQCYSLKKITGFPSINRNFSMAECYAMPVEQIVGVLNNLPSLPSGTTRTLNLTTANINRLSAIEKAIATNKGWTLAN